LHYCALASKPPHNNAMRMLWSPNNIPETR
jgi:hypothetical protein